MPKQEEQAIVARREPQYRQCGASVEVAAPHIGQLSVSACISRILAVEFKLDYKMLLVQCLPKNRERKADYMFRLFAVLFVFLSALPLTPSSSVSTSALAVGQQEDQGRRVLNVPQRRRRRVRGDVRRRRSRGIGSAFGSAGRSAARGGKRFGKYVAHGRPVRGGKEFGKGMGGFGKHFGKGMARVGKRVAKP